ncbi:hypothetical protein HDV00_010911 [Rhizophlyctis rosea]|nr:hypothetical protein HDV00_010911 [Rhizophlyctis rosea]
MPSADTASKAFPVHIPHEQILLEGEVHLPNDPAGGVVVFAHGSGSSRFSPRNQYVAKTLHAHSVGTLLMDLLTADEERIDDRTRELRFNIRMHEHIWSLDFEYFIDQSLLAMLTNRVVSAIDFLAKDTRTIGRPIGTFGASTGGAAALWSAHHRPQNVKCAISRGGRVDLVPVDIQRNLTVPTILIVGELDTQVWEWNQKVYDNLKSAKAKEVVVVKGATHLFEERGCLEEVAETAALYFRKYLTSE